MSNSSRIACDIPSQLVQLGTRFRELRKEKDVLESSESQTFQLVQISERHDKSISEAHHTEYKEHIQRLEKELLNCSQEIDYLRDQLSTSSAHVHHLEEHVRCLKLKLEEMEDLKDVSILREELQRSNSKQFSLMQELGTKEVELEKSALSIQKLEESISSMALESQFEVEGMKLDMMALEQSLFEAKKVQDETLEENNRMCKMIDKLQVEFQEAQKIIIPINEENRELKEKLNVYNMNIRAFSEKVEDWLENNDRSQINNQPCLRERASNSAISENISIYGEVLGPLLVKLAMVVDPATDLKGKMEMSLQIHEYEFAVKKLKEELREEKFKAKEEAEDLAQEMAELRYQFTGLLEEECKRRACIEQASLQRIAKLEAQGV
ncbi:PREDICTED: cingulin-like protein 1 isoform X2 [Lupinus angustifolius]|uniref:cingulin-like protein 1 isoform X2 n=1 Tax=Lupinus angustifolius TaxID=3871 RepID=UPI00092F239A|nr:PREDICTED: cingulin-like protein 1 isoform X2 [Lupinus angustifolius]